jgi:TRAP-type mannitol/chloroaromatic compound transport system permease small subunit
MGAIPAARVDLVGCAWSPQKKQLGQERIMGFLVGYIRAVSGVNRAIGEVLSWLALAMVLVCFTVVVQRYVFHVSVLALQDLYVWMNGAMFTGVAGFALLRDDHVRVDIFYRPWSIRRKAIADLIGVVLFLLPFMVVVGVYSVPYVQRSWRLFEGSANIGGMPGLFVLKTFIPIFAILVGLQGIAWAFRSILVLAGRENELPEHLRYKRHAETPEAVL